MRADNKPRQPGKSRGGITAKIHLLCTSDGKLIDFLIIGGYVSDIKAATELTGKNQMKVLIADKAYERKSITLSLPLPKLMNVPHQNVMKTSFAL